MLGFIETLLANLVFEARPYPRPDAGYLEPLYSLVKVSNLLLKMVASLYNTRITSIPVRIYNTTF